MGAFGLALHGPIGHYWYGFLDRTIMTAAPTSAAAVATKTAIDQILWAPIFTSVFFGSMKAMDGKADEISSEVKEKLWPTMKVNWTVCVFSSCFHMLRILYAMHIHDLICRFSNAMYNIFLPSEQVASSACYQLPVRSVIAAHSLHQHDSSWIQCIPFNDASGWR